MADPTRFLILGNSQSAERFADGFIESGMSCVGAVSLIDELLPTNSKGLSPWASERTTQSLKISDVNGVEFKRIVEQTNPQFLLVQWPKILNQTTLDMFSAGAIGSHPSHLPWGRGRHPLDWQIAMGYSKTFLSIFQLIAEIDAGPLFLQVPIEIDHNETVLTLNGKVNNALYHGGLLLGERLLVNGFIREVQMPTGLGSTWRKRTMEDIEIKCRMSRDSISRLVRSILPPYVGARLVTEFGSLVVIGTCESHVSDWSCYQIGSILKVSSESLTVRVDDGPIELVVNGLIPEGIVQGGFVMSPSFYRR
jgi:methionyl-tRNA formyltransferase